MTKNQHDARRLFRVHSEDFSFEKFEEVLKVDILINISCLLLVVGLNGIGAKHLPGQEGLVLVVGMVCGHALGRNLFEIK